MTACAVLRISHTGFTFSDIVKASAFFRDVLGFSITPPTRQAGLAVERMTGVPGAELDIAFATGGGHTIELIQYVAPVLPRTADKRPCDPGFAHIAFQVEDIDAVVTAINAAGFEAVSPPQIVPAGPRKGGKNVYTRGPDGIVIEFQQAPPAP
jgi:catechol 2,3-dioxygenase-like lactoylglutathione lyase family enzyme